MLKWTLNSLIKYFTCKNINASYFFSTQKEVSNFNRVCHLMAGHTIFHLHFLLYLSELYIQLEVGPGRLRFIGSAVAMSVKTLLQSKTLPIKERISITVNILKVSLQNIFIISISDFDINLILVVIFCFVISFFCGTKWWIIRVVQIVNFHLKSNNGSLI